MRDRSLAFGLVSVLAALLACGGASSVRIGPGKYAIDCGSQRIRCWERAAALCPSGFAVIDGAEHRGAEASRTGNTVIVRETYRGELLVKCQKAKKPASPG